MGRPRRLAFVTGTGTGVGKTWWSCQVIACLRSQGIAAVARKPAQSFAVGDRSRTDVDALAAASDERPEAVCPPHRWYELPMAPPMAAIALGRPPFTIADLVSELVWPGDTAIGLVEGAGGARSPMADDGDCADLARELEPDVMVVIADAGLGTINAVRLTVSSFAEMPVVVALNHFVDGDDLHHRNREWLQQRDGLDVVTEVDALASRLTR